MNALSNPNSELSPAMHKALGLLQSGNTVEAEEIILRSAEETRRKFGAGSHRDAIAQNDLASILLAVGQLNRAIDAFAESVSGPAPSDQQGMRDRLTFLMNLGQALQRAERFEEAEAALQKGLQGREGFYEREHPGYAFGLEPLAEVTFQLGDTETALDMMDEVVRNFWRNGHARIAGAIAIRAAMRLGAGKSEPPFGGLDKLPAETIVDIARQTTARIPLAKDLKVSRRVLAELLPVLNARLGEAHPQSIDVNIAISNVERKLGKEGDASIRQSAIRGLIAIFDAADRPRDALQAVLGLALAHSDAAEVDKAAEAYEQAIGRARDLGDSRETSQVLRNYGLLLTEMQRDADARRTFALAISEAEKCADREMLARSLIALGVSLQHAGELDEAKARLTRALPLIDSVDLDAITCRSHLQAIEARSSCGCGDSSTALADAFREFVMSRLPAGLIKQLDVSMKDGDFSVGVHVNRQPSDEERHRIERVTQHALDEFRRRVGKEN